MHNPLALHALRTALADPEIIGLVSKAPGGLGLTLVLAARQEPFRQWGGHLASFGAQVGAPRPGSARGLAIPRQPARARPVQGAPRPRALPSPAPPSRAACRPPNGATALQPPSPAWWLSRLTTSCSSAASWVTQMTT